MYGIIRSVSSKSLRKVYLIRGGISMVTKGRFYFTLLVASVVAFILWACIRIDAFCEFENQIKGHLTNYTRAGTTETAIENLSKAIEALEEKGLTEGEIFILVKSPKNDIGVWYKNLVESKKLLEKSREESLSQQAIILEKQKSALVGKSGVIVPVGISIYPMNHLYFYWCMLSLTGMVGFFLKLLELNDKKELRKPLLKIKDNKQRASA